MTDQLDTVLYVIASLQNQGQVITRDALLQPLNLLGRDTESLEDELRVLVSRGLLRSAQNGEYLLSESGQSAAAAVFKSKVREEFSETMNRASNSGAYLDFCAQVYGYRMPLFNMMDKEQLDYVFDLIPVSAGDTILDIGCGTGGILNHLVEKYGCRGIGIDQVETPRVAGNGVLSFIRADIDCIMEYGLTPSITIAVDSLYFSADLDTLLRNLTRIPHNRLYLFYSQYIMDSGKKDERLLQPGGTRVGAVLYQAGIPCKTIDFSKNERRLYEAGLDFLPQYRDSFEAEGNIGLYETKLKEYTTGKTLYDQGLASRHLYIVESR